MVDNVFYGAVPPGGETSDVLVFVHGLGGLVQDWWNRTPSPTTPVNDMYDLAYEAGYRTAFVNLNVDPDAAGDCTVTRKSAQDIATNGRTLARQLEAITSYYGVSKVDIVAHSKGGVDTQAAIVDQGAWTQVRTVFAIGTPFFGSTLVDFVCGPDASPELQKVFPPDEALCSLRPALMAEFQTRIGTSLLDDAIRFYSGAGTGWRRVGEKTAFYTMGELLQNMSGDNDVLVAVSSTELPGAEPLFKLDLHHFEVFLGTNAFPYIHEILLKKSVWLPLVGSGAASEDSLNTFSSKNPAPTR